MYKRQFLNSSKSRVSGLEVIRGGRILKKVDGHSSSIGMRLSDENIPVWAALDFTRIGSSHYDYSDGSSITANRRYIKSVTAGWFINEALGVYSFYEVDDDVDSYGVGTHYLHNLGVLGFIEAGFQYTKIETEYTDLEVVNGTVRNANVNSTDESIARVGLSYFPTVKAKVGVAYQKIDYDHDLEGSTLTLNASYYVLPNLQLGINYYELFQDDKAIRVGKLEYKSLGGNLSYKF